MGVKSLNQLLTDIGLGRKTSTIVAERFYDGLQIRKDKRNAVKSFELKNNKIDGLGVIYTKCCMPMTVIPLLHTLTLERIVIHHAKCKQVALLNKIKIDTYPFGRKTIEDKLGPVI